MKKRAAVTRKIKGLINADIRDSKGFIESAILCKTEKELKQWLKDHNAVEYFSYGIDLHDEISEEY
jgi:hypothetical protein